MTMRKHNRPRNFNRPWKQTKQWETTLEGLGRLYGIGVLRAGPTDAPAKEVTAFDTARVERAEARRLLQRGKRARSYFRSVAFNRTLHWARHTAQKLIGRNITVDQLLLKIHA